MRRREGLVFMTGNDSWVGYDICHIQSCGACLGSDTWQQVEPCLLILKWQQTFTSAASSDRYGKKGEVWNLEASATELRKLKINDFVTLISFLHYPGRVHVCTVRPKHVFSRNILVSSACGSLVLQRWSVCQCMLNFRDMAAC